MAQLEIGLDLMSPKKDIDQTDLHRLEAGNSLPKGGRGISGH